MFKTLREILTPAPPKATPKPAERRALAKQYAQLTREAASSAELHDRVIEELTTKAQAAREAFLAADAKRAEACRRKSTDGHSKAAQLSKLAAALVRSADPRIAAAKHAMQDHLDQNRELLNVTVFEDSGYVDTRSQRPLTIAKTNRKATDRLIAAIAEARNRFDDLVLEDPADVDAAIAEVLKPVEEAWAQIHTREPE